MRIIRNYFYTAGYNLLILLTPLLTVPYISRVLGPTGVGINATTNSIITYFLLFGTVGITIYGIAKLPSSAIIARNAHKLFGKLKYYNFQPLVAPILLF